MSVNVTDMSQPAKRGRPSGLLINPDAARYFLRQRPQSWLAVEAGVSTAHLSEILKGSKGATNEVAHRLADVLDPDNSVVSILFPELVEFRTEVRVFTAGRIEEAA